MIDSPRSGFLLPALMLISPLLFIFVMPFVNRYNTPVFDDLKSGAPHLEHRVIPAALRDAELLSHMDAGEKIHAIKRLRELTGAGLKEAKDTIDRLEQERTRFA